MKREWDISRLYRYKDIKKYIQPVFIEEDVVEKTGKDIFTHTIKGKRGGVIFIVRLPEINGICPRYLITNYSLFRWRVSKKRLIRELLEKDKLY